MAPDTSRIGNLSAVTGGEPGSSLLGLGGVPPLDPQLVPPDFDRNNPPVPEPSGFRKFIQSSGVQDFGKGLGIAGDTGTRLRVCVNGRRIDTSLGELLQGSRVERMGGPSDQKFKLYEPVHESRCCVDLEMTDESPGSTWYYLRVVQQNGQMAWSSPVWVDRE